MNSLIRTELIWMNQNYVISSLCHFSKNLWNEANYAVRQEFINNHFWIRYNTLAGTFKTSENFKSLNAQTAQQI
jgi:putative transposase